MAVEAIKQGARDFLTKPVTDFQKLKALLDDAENEIELRRKTKRLANRVESEGQFGDFVGASKPMREVFSMIEMVATRDVPVIITGESGTGKELVAHAIHEMSARRGKPFDHVRIESDAGHHQEGLRGRARRRILLGIRDVDGRGLAALQRGGQARCVGPKTEMLRSPGRLISSRATVTSYCRWDLAPFGRRRRSRPGAACWRIIPS